MIIVMQCASSKNATAGHLNNAEGRAVKFVSRPDLAPQSGKHVYAHPDETTASGTSWRKMLEHYNADPSGNPLGLLPAWQLYSPAIYQRLARHFSPQRFYILSAGWGLIRSDFLTPLYDITFSNAAAAYKKRTTRTPFRDVNHLPPSLDEPLVFLGGKSYQPLFLSLTSQYSGQRVLLFNSQEPPAFRGCLAVRFPTPRRTNWHYSAAEALLDGSLRIPV